MDESASLLVAVVIGVLLIATLMLFLVPEPSGVAYVADAPFEVAVLGFRNSSTWSGVEETVRSRVEAKLVNTPGIEVFSRAQLDALLIERALDASDPFDAATAIEIGTLSGVSRLITGSVYAVDTRSDETTICIDWSGGQCVTRVPGVAYSARVLTQIEVIDVKTGQIERVFDLDGSDSISLPTGTAFGGFDSLLAAAASEIADEISTSVTSDYFRTLRYGLYSSFEAKRDGYIGRSETDRFSTSDTAYLIVHATRMQDRERFDVEWIAPSGEVIRREEDLIGQGDWRLYALDLAGFASGRYSARVEVGGVEAFQQLFTVSP